MRAVVVAKTAVSGPKQVGKIDLDGDKSKETKTEEVIEKLILNQNPLIVQSPKL